MLRIPKRAKKSWSEDSMSAAVKEARNGSLSIRQAADRYNVPRSTLSDRVTNRVDEGCIWGSKPRLTMIDESKLIETAKTRAHMGIGFTKHNFLRAAAGLAKVRGLDFKKDKPSEMWWRRLKGRHGDFSLRSPEPTGCNRHQAMTRERMA